jgi:DNA-binding GntR family transcriptional regulator
MTEANETPPPGSQARADHIYQTLRNRICTNRVSPDEVLREAELASEFNVSRSPIRRVLAKLEHEGLVEVRHGVGTRVTRIDAGALIEIYNVRMSIAAQTGPYFKQLTPDHAAMFDRHKALFQALAPGDIHGFADTNLAYYADLTEMIENTCLRAIHRNLFFSTSRMWLIQLPLVNWQRTIDSICEELDEITRAIRHEDPTGLGYAMRSSLAFNINLFRSAGVEG